MDEQTLYALVHEAVGDALNESFGGSGPIIHKRMMGGRVLFEDADGREAKAVPVEQFFKKVTSIREKLRVLEQKLNNHPSLDRSEVAELQGYLTRCYGTLTTFNFMFQSESDKFKGSGS